MDSRGPVSVYFPFCKIPCHCQHPQPQPPLTRPSSCLKSINGKRLVSFLLENFVGPFGCLKFYLVRVIFTQTIETLCIYIQNTFSRLLWIILINFVFRIPDTWVPLEEVSSTKTVKICNLPSCAKQKLYHGVLGQPVRTKQSRKTKRNNDYNPFLTPAESEARALRHSSSPWNLTRDRKFKPNQQQEITKPSITERQTQLLSHSFKTHQAFHSIKSSPI